MWLLSNASYSIIIVATKINMSIVKCLFLHVIRGVIIALNTDFVVYFKLRNTNRTK